MGEIVITLSLALIDFEDIIVPVMRKELAEAYSILIFSREETAYHVLKKMTC